MWGAQLGVKPTQSSGRSRNGVLYIQIPNLISRGVRDQHYSRFALPLQMIYILIYLNLLLDTIL